MTQISVSLSAEDINDAVAKAIVASTLGETIKKMVDEYVKSLSSSYQNPVKKVVEEESRAIIIQLLEEHKPALKEAVQKEITGNVADRMITVAVEKFIKSIYL